MSSAAVNQFISFGLLFFDMRSTRPQPSSIDTFVVFMPILSRGVEKRRDKNRAFPFPPNFLWFPIS